MNSSRRVRFLLVALMLTLGAGILAQTQKSPQQADILFESAKQKELVEGKLQEAIQLYQRIVQEYAANRPAAAKALLRMGQCYERLGQADARQAYERLVREFGDQAETVAEARVRLAALAGPASARKTEMTARRIWTGRDTDSTGSPSSDGRFLAATDWTTGDIVLRDPLTGELRPVTRTGDIMKTGAFAFYAKLSPDDKRIAYAWYDTKASQFDLWLISTDGTGARQLYREEKAAYVFPACWTPDGKSIVAIVNMAKGDKSRQIVLVSAETGAVRVLKSATQDEPTRISASPDGRFIVYDVAQADGKKDIFLMSLADGRESRLVSNPADDRGPIWTPDGQHVLFVSDRIGSAGLWIQEVVDGQAPAPPELVKPDTGRIHAIGFPKSGVLYYGLNMDVSEVLVGNCDLKAGRLMGRPAAPPSDRLAASRSLPSWSPDGKLLSFVSRSDPPRQGSTITIRAMEADDERDIQVDVSPVRQLNWWPDGSALVVPGLDRERKPGVFKVDLKTGTVTTLVKREGVPIAQAAVAHDGKLLVYFGYTSDSNLLVIRDLQTGNERTLMKTTPWPIGMAVSPDGRMLAVATSDDSNRRYTVIVVPVAGGDAREIFRMEGADAIQGFPGFPIWTPDGRNVLLGSRSSDKTGYLLVPVEGGEPMKITSPRTGINYISFHPNGTRVAVAASQSRTEVWVLENFLPPVKR
jgi:Tol biopolymer transport system component